MPLRLLVAAALLSLSLAPAAHAQEASPRHRLIYEALAGARANPIGAALSVDAGYTYRLFDSESLLLKDAFAGLFLIPAVTPSNYRVGVAAVLEPLAVLRLRAAISYVGYFGSFDELQSYGAPGANWSPEARELGGELGHNYSAGGMWAALGGRLQAKVGPVAVRNGLRFIHTDMDLAEGDTVYYDSTLDLLMPREGWSFIDEADLLWLGWDGWILGLRYVASGALYDAAEENLTTHRIGPLLLKTFPDGGDPRFVDPTLAVVTGWWLSHPYRTGTSVSQLVPYVTVAFAVKGDLF